jgi:hypothetical protein
MQNISEYFSLCYFYNAFGALLSRKILWRGIGYKLKSPTETVVTKENTTNKNLSSSDELN